MLQSTIRASNTYVRPSLNTSMIAWSENLIYDYALHFKKAKEWYTGLSGLVNQEVIKVAPILVMKYFEPGHSFMAADAVHRKLEFRSALHFSIIQIMTL